jgi:alpha-ketoglutarate-dependent taurine dioxygenase
MLENLNKAYICAKEGKGKILCYEANDEETDITKLIELNKKQIEDDLLTYGGVLLRNFNIRSLSEFNKLANMISPNLLDYVNRSTPRTKLGGKIYTATEYPPDKFIPFHNENSYTQQWPNKIIFFSVIAAEDGGETAIADSRNVYDNIDKEIIDKFNEKKVLYVRNFTPGIDLSWQEVFQTEEKREVERYCNSHSIDYEWKTGDIELTTKQVCQAIIKHPVTQEDVWFNQAHLFHISSLDKNDRKELMQLLGKDKLTRNAFYGDGSEIDEDYLDEIRQAYEKERIEFSWRKGDVMILDNRLMAHSRNPFKGNRKVVVAMGD